jgi:hypothetical protein
MAQLLFLCGENGNSAIDEHWLIWQKWQNSEMPDRV